MKKLLLIVVLVLTACSQTTLFEFIQHPATPLQTEELENILRKQKEIEKANIVMLEKELIVAAQVKPFNKIKKQEVEKAIEKAIKNKFPDQEVLVSTDFKIYWETSKLINTDIVELEKKVQELKKLTEEET